MNKEQFLFLAKNYTSLTGDETSELEQVQKEFPYCQAARVLVARGAQDQKLPTFQKQLHVCAVYATDRSVLKAILSQPLLSRTQAETAPTPTVATNPTMVNLAGDQLINEVMADLDRLQELKHNFEITIQEYDKAVGSQSASKKKITDAPRQKNESAPSHTIKPVEEPASTPNPEAIHEDEHTGDDLLEEIRSKKKLRPETNKQKEQLHIIDQFIKKQPSITKNSLPAIDSPDLAEKSISLTDNIVSETLVEILLRQGKKDKAIEVLKKLIWKFPQKKSIFAAQIEELRR